MPDELDQLSGDPLVVVATWPVDAAVAVTDATTTLAQTGDPTVARPWASVTKLLTAVTVLVALEEGSVDLDQPAGPPGSTVRHLLAHASGLGPDGGVLAAPGTRRIYSNAGFEALGEEVAAATAMPFAAYLRAGVLEPLGLSSTRLEGSPAAGARGPLRDLVRFARELLAPTLISPATLAAATRVAFPGLDGVLPGYGVERPNDWGLGFELRSSKSPHWSGKTNSPRTFGHFGRSGSLLWVDPDAGIACAEVSDTAFGPWAVTAWPPLADAVVGAFGRPQTDRR